MKKVLVVGVPMLCSLLFSGCSVSKTPEPVQSTEVTEELSTGILETEVIVEDVTEEQDVVDATGTFETAKMTDISYDMLGSGYYSLIEVDGNVYLLDISSITYTSSSDGNIWYLTEDAVKFASNGSSAEALFKALADKEGKFVTYSGGKYVDLRNFNSRS